MNNGNFGLGWLTKIVSNQPIINVTIGDIGLSKVIIDSLIIFFKTQIPNQIIYYYYIPLFDKRPYRTSVYNYLL